MNKLTIEYLPLEDLKPYANNAKIHTEEQIQQIRKSIEEFGMNDPIAIWKDNEIIEGHGRLLACQQMGMKEVPVIRLDNLTDEQRRAYMNVHNQLTMNTGFDMERLNEELGKIDNIDMSLFGFDMDKFAPGADWFSERERNDTGREEGNDEYNEWLDKFEQKKTTDDCYTPDVVYEAVAEWVEKEYGVNRSTFVRPFYPGGDYVNEKYPEGCAVVDNPPFSILAEIVRFYTENGIRFFLFAPSLTLFSGRVLDVCYIPADGDITYENGAVVNTSFITNLDKEYMVRTAPELTEAIKAADKANKEELAKPINLKYRYPSYVITAAMVGKWAGLGVDFKVRKGEGYRISSLDAQKEFDKAIYGSGFLLSEKARADAEKARADAEKARVLEAAKALEAANVNAMIEIDQKTGEIVWQLSERERDSGAAIIEGRGGNRWRKRSGSGRLMQHAEKPEHISPSSVT